jgi:hypothetical protein
MSHHAGARTAESDGMNHPFARQLQRSSHCGKVTGWWTQTALRAGIAITAITMANGAILSVNLCSIDHAI